MRGCVNAGTLALLVLGIAPGCEIARPRSLDPEVVALTVVLEAGEREALLTAWHPHAGASSAPAITAALEGPGWKASFSHTVDPCPHQYALPNVVCLGAVLPEAVRPGARYGLSGEAPLGAFTGRMEMPNPPVLIEPRDTFFGYADVPLRYRVDRTIGILLGDIGGGCSRVTRKLNLNSAGVDTVAIYRTDIPCTVSPLRLAGVGLNYARFMEAVGRGDHLVRRPWPESGIEGEGVYGYFDGVGYSRTVVVAHWAPS